MSTIGLQRAQNRLLVLWTVGGGIVFLLTLLKAFDPNATSMNRFWSWTIPSIFPTLLLIIGARAGSAIADRRGQEKEVDRLFFLVTVGVSAFYLVTAFITLWAAIHWSTNGLDFLATSSYYLGPLQGLTSASLGAFFVSRKH
jgi:hypothetical protein